METNTQRALRAAAALRATLVALIAQVDELCLALEAGPADPGPEPAPGAARPAVVRSSFAVTWREGTCVLGPTMAFWLMARLARSPNQYVHVDDLLDELWEGQRAYSTVRSTVCRLRARLCAARMGDLAAMIDGSMRNHYRLTLRGA